MKGRINVLEVSQAVAGPTASQILADYGAKVTKIERPGTGDIFRNTPGMGPSFFLAVNRGKRSIELDLGASGGRKLFYDLVADSDVVIENLSPGAAEKLGITFARIKRANPLAIYCRIESFGEGPYENTPAFDPVLQAAVGIMSTTGFAPDKFARAGVSIVDMSAAFHAVIGIMELLLRRTRTKKGGQVEVSLFDAAAYYMSYWLTLFDLTGKDTKPLGSTHLFGSPYNLFKTKDGLVYIAIADDKSWESFCGRLGFKDLESTGKYKTRTSRAAFKTELEEEIGRRLGSLSTASVLSRLKNSGVAISKFNTTRSLIRDPHFKARKLAQKYSYEGYEFKTVVNPVIIDGKRPFTKQSPPGLGQHTKEVIDEIQALRKIR